jgi:hypothetical protein
LLVYDSYRGVSVVTFLFVHVLYHNMVYHLHYYTTIWFITSIILLPTPFPLTWCQQVSMFYIHACIESTWTYLPSFTLFIYPPLPPSTVYITWSALHSCPSLFICLFVVQWNFCLGSLSVNILCLNWSKPLYLSSSPISPYLVI